MSIFRDKEKERRIREKMAAANAAIDFSIYRYIRRKDIVNGVCHIINEDTGESYCGVAREAYMLPKLFARLIPVKQLPSADQVCNCCKVSLLRAERLKTLLRLMKQNDDYFAIGAESTAHVISRKSGEGFCDRINYDIKKDPRSIRMVSNVKKNICYHCEKEYIRIKLAEEKEQQMSEAAQYIDLNGTEYVRRDIVQENMSRFANLQLSYAKSVESCEALRKNNEILASTLDHTQAVSAMQDETIVELRATVAQKTAKIIELTDREIAAAAPKGETCYIFGVTKNEVVGAESVELLLTAGPGSGTSRPPKMSFKAGMSINIRQIA